MPLRREGAQVRASGESGASAGELSASLGLFPRSSAAKAILRPEALQAPPAPAPGPWPQAQSGGAASSSPSARAPGLVQAHPFVSSRSASWGTSILSNATPNAP